MKVTPSSKMVGDLAIFMVQNDLTPKNIVERGENMTFPDSAVSYFKGVDGTAAVGIPKGTAESGFEGGGTYYMPPGRIASAYGF